MAKVIVTGANGQIGRELQVLASHYPEFQFHFCSRFNLDVTDEQAVQRLFNEYPADYCINAAAYTAVDRAESEPEAARKANTDAPGYLAKACAGLDIPMIHYSTDYVYHNALNRPLLETDPTSPKSVYADTKLEGDEAALAAHNRVIVLRTSWVYSAFGHNFVKTMLRLGRERDELRVVFDQIGSPTYARSLAQASLGILQQLKQGSLPAEAQHGVYHYSNEGVCSWYDFASAIFELEGLSCQIYPIRSEDFPTAAQRPPFSVLDKSRFKQAFGYAIPHWRTDLQKMLAALKQMQHTER
jgi:dTDP-4-dehydrorhamnose reductase